MNKSDIMKYLAHLPLDRVRLICEGLTTAYFYRSYYCDDFIEEMTGEPSSLVGQRDPRLIPLLDAAREMLAILKVKEGSSGEQN